MLTMRAHGSMLLMVLLALAAAAGEVRAQAYSSLEERMSAADFRAAGLDKLSAEELATLNRWLEGNGEKLFDRGRDGRAARGDNLLGDSGRPEVGTRIAGTIERIETGDILTLENGQRWRVTSGSLRLVEPLTSAPVLIQPGFLSSWKLKVDGYNATLRVERVD
jgi:hypothetical protein